MNLRGMSTERLLGVTARLLAASAVLVVVALGLVLRLSWQQTEQMFPDDGTTVASSPALGTRLMFMVAETGYRPVALQTLLAAVIVAAAVAALHGQAERMRSRWARWEVLAAGVVVLVPVVALVLGHLFVMTSEDTDPAVTGGYLGPQSMNEYMFANLATSAASLALLAGAGLWWLNLEQDVDDDVVGEPSDEDDPDEDGLSEDGTTEDAYDAGPVHERRTTSAARDDSTDGPAVDYSRDWSPEDFRPPR